MPKSLRVKTSDFDIICKHNICTLFLIFNNAYNQYAIFCKSNYYKYIFVPI